MWLESYRLRWDPKVHRWEDILKFIRKSEPDLSLNIAEQSKGSVVGRRKADLHTTLSTGDYSRPLLGASESISYEWNHRNAQKGQWS